MNDSKSRFSDRVGDYVKYRPTYPKNTLSLLTTFAGLNENSVIADIGSGTGISSELFLKNGNQVFAIEPNQAMREAAEKLLSSYPNFKSLGGSAEKTGLEDHSIDIIVAAQAFHWFDPVSTKQEFKRILTPEGKVILIWNERKMTGTPFADDYENLLLEFGTDYKNVRHTNIDEDKLKSFLGEFQYLSLRNEQVLDWDGLLGRLSSSSYVPSKDSIKFQAMKKRLMEVYERNQQEGVVIMEYLTQIYISTRFS